MTTAQETRMPSLAPPDDADTIHVFIKASGDTLCGGKGAGHPTCGLISWEGHKACPRCSRPVCPTCFDVARVYMDTGLLP